MTRRKKALLITAASIVGLLVVIVIGAVSVLRTQWFADFARAKIVAAANDATGGTAEMQAFELDLRHLTVKIHNFVLHGKEARKADPLFRLKLLELRLKLLTAWAKPFDIRYLGADEPRVNVIVLPDGTTNIPEPKTPSKPSQTSGLQTVVDLAVNEFRLTDGFASVLQEKAAFSGRGESLRVVLNYNSLKPSYTGALSISPLLLQSGNRAPLRINVNVPVTIERDAIRIANARMATEQSHVILSADVVHMQSPVISGHLTAALSPPEIERTVDLPIHSQNKGAPRQLTVDVVANLSQSTNIMQIEHANLALGRTTFDASGKLDPNRPENVQFKANFALPELAQLLALSGVRLQGDLQADGRATLDQHKNYAVDGALQSRNLAVQSSDVTLQNVNLSSPFHADPFLISLDGLRLNALGGSLGAKIFLENLQNLSVEGQLRNFSIPTLVTVASGKHLGYDGALNGSILARADLKAKGTTGYTANADFSIVPGRREIPLSGRLKASYIGKSGALDLANSYILLPNSRLTLAGSLNRRIKLDLMTQNLSDFLPAANFGSAHPQTSLPVALNGGTARVHADITGKTSAPNVMAHAEISDFSVEQRPFSRLALDANGSPVGAAVRNGLLVGRGLETEFDASIGLRQWAPEPSSPVSANLVLHNGDLADLIRLAGQAGTEASGKATADVHVRGTYGNPLGAATFQVLDGSLSDQAFQKLFVNVALEDQLATLTRAELDLAGGRIEAHGRFQHPRDSFTAGRAQLQLAADNVQLSQIQALAKQNAGIKGVLQLTASTDDNLRQSANQTKLDILNVTADFSARALEIQNRDAGELTASARTSNGSVNYKVDSNFAGSDIKVRGNTALSGAYATAADASIKHLSISKALQIVGQSAVPASGDLSADAHVNGTTSAPHADLTFALLDGNVYQEPVNSLRGSVNYSPQLIHVSSIKLDAPAGNVSVSGSYTHPLNTFDTGSLKLNVNSSDIQLARIRNIQLQKPGLAGTLHIATDLAADLRNERGKPALLISNLNGETVLAGLRLNSLQLGGATLRARTNASKLDLTLDSDLMKSNIRGSGQAQLSGDFPLRGSLSFTGIRYSNIAPFLASNQSTSAPPFEALVEGGVTFDGPMADPGSLAARLQLDHFDFRTNGTNSPTGSPALRKVELQNDGPVVVALNQDVVRIEQLRIGARNTALSASGSVNLKDALEPLALNLDAHVDLALLQDADRDFYSSGSLTMNTSIRGSFAQPRANGRVELKNANINYAGAPNGLSNANGLILLNGTNASIQKLTGESGGGQIALSGFVGLGSRVPSFNLKAAVARVRVRYSGISTTSNANLSLTGNLRRSLVSGTVSVERIAYASSSDAGSLLSAASIPPSTPASPNPLLAGMRLDVHILTAPDLQVVSTYANRLSVLANLSLRGTAENPGMLGRMTVTDGQLVFFGNTYTVTTGTINFYDPNSISPNLNVSLQTVAQGVDVTIGVSGLMDDLKLTYRSDPPLSFEQIVQLLATNTTPANPVIAAHQPSPPQQSVSQMGESAVLGQAVANPLASRVQRVFGLTQFKIDPSFSGNGGQPSARVTLQQKVASNITFTYITDVSQTNGQIVRVQWDLSNNLSAVGLRDYNGNVSIEFFYKFTRR